VRGDWLSGSNEIPSWALPYSMRSSGWLGVGLGRETQYVRLFVGTRCHRIKTAYANESQCGCGGSRPGMSLVLEDPGLAFGRSGTALLGTSWRQLLTATIAVGFVSRNPPFAQDHMPISLAVMVKPWCCVLSCSAARTLLRGRGSLMKPQEVFPGDRRAS